MRIALAGFGGAGSRGHLPALKQLEAHGTVELAGVCDANPKRLCDAAQLVPDVPRYRDAESLLLNHQPDLLVIATEPAAHLDLIELGLAYGCDILCEKPVVVAPAACRRLRELRVRWPNRLVMPIHQYRYSPVWNRFTAWARSVPDQPVHLMVQVGRPGTDPHASSVWRTDPGSGGGLADHGVHYLAMARDLKRGLLAVRAVHRTHDDIGREHVRCRLGVGTGVFELAVNYGADQRRTTIRLCLGTRSIRWSDGQLTWTGTGGLASQAVPALSERSHVDSLYLPLYKDLLAHRSSSSWRSDCWQEILEVCEILADLATFGNEIPDCAHSAC